MIWNLKLCVLRVFVVRLFSQFFRDSTFVDSTTEKRGRLQISITDEMYLVPCVSI